MPAGMQADSEYILQTIAREGVTIAYFVPSQLRVLLATEGVSQRTKSLRYVICGGEAMSGSLLREFERQVGAELHHSYGPTETSIAASEWQSEEEVAEVVPMGRPLANTELYVLDEQMEPVPVGAVGELYIG
jgi:non-ribosomal peptide synthetase component F